MEQRTYKQEKADRKQIERKLHQRFILCGLFALLVVPSGTVALAGRDNALYYSLSAIGNAAGNRMALVLWTLGSSGFFMYAVRLLLWMCRRQDSLAKPLMDLAAGLLVLCNLLPFTPAELPRLAQYHNFLATAGSCLLALSLLILVIDLRDFDKGVGRKSAGLLALIGVSGGLPFFFFGISGMLEAVCIVLVCLFLFFTMMLVLMSNAHDSMLIRDKGGKQTQNR